MLKYRNYVFVLWSDQFEEAAAAIFVTELRTAGLRVKLVGLTPQPISGLQGLILNPDLTLDQALPLANNTICIIIPYRSPTFKRLGNDPRLAELLERAQANRASLVIGWSTQTDAVNEALFLAIERVIVYPSNEDLVVFARQLAGSCLKL